MPTHESQKDKRKSNRYSEETPLYPGQSLMPPTFAPKAGEALPSKDWQPDQGGNLYYNTKREAEKRKAQLEGQDENKAYRVKSFARGKKVYWRVEIGSQAKRKEQQTEPFRPEMATEEPDSTRVEVDQRFIPFPTEEEGFIGPQRPKVGPEPDPRYAEIPDERGFIFGPVIEGHDAYFTQAAAVNRRDGVKGLRASEARKGTDGKPNYNSSCKIAAMKMLQNAGFTSALTQQNKIATITRSGRAKAKSYGAAMEALDENLRKGMPVLVGVDRGENNNDYDTRDGTLTSTDHFIVIVGKGKDDIGEFYAYFDPGRFGKQGYDLEANRLYANTLPDKNKKLKEGKDRWSDYAYASSRGEVYYTLAEVRESKKK